MKTVSRTYKGFTLNFKFSEDTLEFLKKHKVNPDSYCKTKEEQWEWFEVFLFDTLDPESNGEPDKAYGKEFDVLFVSYSLDVIRGNQEIPFKVDYDPALVLLKTKQKIADKPFLLYYVLMKAE